MKQLRSNNELQRNVIHCGRPVLAIDGVLAGPEWASWPSAELGRQKACMTPGNLKEGRAYYRITYADPKLTIPGVEPMMYVGVDIFPDEKPSEPRYYFQDTVSFHQHGSYIDYSGPAHSEEDTPCNVFSFTARELGTGLVDLPEAIRLLNEANERAGQR